MVNVIYRSSGFIDAQGAIIVGRLFIVKAVLENDLEGSRQTSN